MEIRNGKSLARFLSAPDTTSPNVRKWKVVWRDNPAAWEKLSNYVREFGSADARKKLLKQVQKWQVEASELEYDMYLALHDLSFTQLCTIKRHFLEDKGVLFSCT
jgi:hypothetical protein